MPSGARGVRFRLAVCWVRLVLVVFVVFFFSSRRRHTRFDCDWSSDVCSSDLAFGGRILGEGEPKYLNSPDTPIFHKGKLLYNLHVAKHAMRKAERAILVEGY